LKNKKKVENHALYLVGEREKKKQEMIIDDNPTTIHRRASHHVKKDMVARPKKQWKVRFGYRVVLNVPPKWRGMWMSPTHCMCQSLF
jgi:hypothetical protein